MANPHETPLREFASAAELRAFYRELRKRTQSLQPPPKPPKSPPAPEAVFVLPAPPPPRGSGDPIPPPDPIFLSRMARIIRAVSREFETPVELIRKPTRLQQVVVPRHVAAWLARELTKLSLPQIGRELGHRDHTTILHAINSIERKLANHRDLAERVERLRAQLAEAG